MPSRKTNSRSDSHRGDGAGAPSPAPFTVEERMLIARVAKYLELHPPEEPSRWVIETIGLVREDLERRWIPNPRMMEYQQPVGEWVTVLRAGRSSATPSGMAYTVTNVQRTGGNRH